MLSAKYFLLGESNRSLAPNPVPRDQRHCHQPDSIPQTTKDVTYVQQSVHAHGGRRYSDDDVISSA